MGIKEDQLATEKEKEKLKQESMEAVVESVSRVTCRRVFN